MNGLIWFWPAVVVALAMSWAFGPVVARTLRTDRRLAWLLVLGIGLVVAAVLTPIRPPVGVDVTIARNCDFGRRWFAAVPDMLVWSETSLTVAAFIPVGIAIGLLPMSIRSSVVALGVIALPGGVEALQYVVPMLARACKSGDAIDGLTGLGIGLVVGVVIRFGRHFWRRRPLRTNR